MGLSVFNSAKKTTAITDSLLGIGNGFIIYLNKNKFWSTNTDKWRLPGLEYFTGINLENISLNFQTNWGDAGGAILGKKIADYMNSKFIKFLAGQSEQGFQEFICSDAWTLQKVCGEASPIKVELKFRAYNEDKMGYDTVLRNRIAQRDGNVLLTDEVCKCLWTPFPGQYDIGCHNPSHQRCISLSHFGSDLKQFGGFRPKQSVT